MKKNLIIAVSAFLSIFIFTGNAQAAGKKTETVVPANDSRIEYTGRTCVNGENVSYDWSGTYFRVRFSGESLSMRCSDTGGDWFNVWIDKEMAPVEDARLFISGADTTVVLAKGLGKGVHEVLVQKRTEGEQGRFTVSSFICNGEILQANGRKERHIEFIGDSYTCGYGTESNCASDPFEARTENCNLTYAAITARFYDADFNLVSHSGQGIARNYDDFRPGYNMPDRYSQTFDMDENIAWNPEGVCWRPDIVVIYLCTNDFSTGRQPLESVFVGRYIELLRKVKANYGEDIPVLCLASNADERTLDYIRTSCKMSGLKNLHYLGLTDGVHNGTSDLGASAHPNYQGQRKVASCVIPYISSLTGWEMPEKAVR